jgi:hypothetical protein
MMLRRSLPVTAALATLVAPFAALAQATGSVTTDPVRLAPALGLPLIVLLAVLLAGVAVFRLRRATAGPIARIALIATVTVLAGVGYATLTTITISGVDCTKQTVHLYDPTGSPVTLMNDCVTPITIDDITTSCIAGPISPSSPTEPTRLPPCEVGQTLPSGADCSLPNCRV